MNKDSCDTHEDVSVVAVLSPKDYGFYIALVKCDLCCDIEWQELEYLTEYF